MLMNLLCTATRRKTAYHGAMLKGMYALCRLSKFI